MEAVLRVAVLVSFLTVILPGCRAGGAAIPGERQQAEAHYYAVAGLAEGEWRATPITMDAREPIEVELSFSPLLPLPSDARTFSPYPIGTVTITTDAWVAQAHVYEIERKMDDQSIEPCFVAEASESESLPLDLAAAPKWRIVILETYEGGFMSRALSGTRPATGETGTQPESEAWALQRERTDG